MTKMLAASEGVTTNWLDLPEDVMITIFMKLGPFEVFYSAQGVCSSWRNLAKEPRIFRSIVISRRQWSRFGKYYPNLAKQAVDRSCGEVAEISFVGWDWDCCWFLQYIADQPNMVKRLRMEHWSKTSDVLLIKYVTKFPLLEELELKRYYFSREEIKELGRCCPKLKYLRLEENLASLFGEAKCTGDEDAFAIAESMPQLRHLTLLVNCLSNDGLRAIIDGCPYLEYLELRQWHIKFEVELIEKCVSRIRDVRLR
ncbi:hypothetical protein IFM89_018996 [Coptis chinensis]|uniref:F-box domain-containing protein n=1 Tax=Coptis chinensis TaxID=261450 RepID=A0A835I4L4_9MAGN|nr:hypothetical protein IFM89_018996 [Coptis chinensis]